MPSLTVYAIRQAIMDYVVGRSSSPPPQGPCMLRGDNHTFFVSPLLFFLRALYLKGPAMRTSRYRSRRLKFSQFLYLVRMTKSQ